MFYKCLAIISLVASAMSAASPNLDIYWIDAEGGASTLIVTPAGQSMLIDTANRTPDDRDAKRIFAATQQAGLEEDRLRFDYALSRRSRRRDGGARQVIPIGQYIDHGESIELDRPRGIELYKNYVALTQGKRKSVKPGDSIPLKGVKITVVASGGRVLSKPLKGGGTSPSDMCKDVQQKAAETDIENNESVGILLTFGKFKFLDLGDLPWNYEKALVCPQNLIGTVDCIRPLTMGSTDPGCRNWFGR